MKTNRAFSAITIKSVSEDAREITGLASTPALDRVKDIVEPLGLSFAQDAPLLLNHDHSQPVGTVQFGAPTTKGLPFVARIAKVDEDGVVKTRTDEAWHSVKSGLIKGVSIGFIPSEYESLGKDMGTRFTKAAVHELSLVSIPCNPEAVITAFKSLALAETAEAGEVTGETPIAVVEAAAVATTVETTVVKTPRLVKLDLSYRKY